MQRTAYRAEYTPSPLFEYQGNPLIEALPPIMSEVDALQAMLHFPPPVTDGERLLDKSVRLHGTDRLRSVVHPLMVHLELESEFSALIRSGYVKRNPFSVDVVRHLHSISTNERLSGSFTSSASTFSLVGLSGVGKSTALDSITKSYPQIIFHTEYMGKPFVHAQIPWLKFDCPFDGSLSGLCKAFFRAIDVVIGEDRYSKIAQRVSLPSMIQLMEQIASTYYLGALVIDEIQNLRSAKSGGTEKMLNFFVNLINVIGIPVVFVGNNSMLELFGGVLRNARRLNGRALIEFERFDRHKDGLWDMFCRKLWDSYNWCQKGNPYNQEISDTLYDLSQGVTDFAVKLMVLGQKEAIHSRAEFVSSPMLRKVFESRMKILAPALSALRSGDPRVQRRFEDLLPVKDQIDAIMLSNASTTVDRYALLQSLRVIDVPTPPVAKEQADKRAAVPVHQLGLSISKEISESPDPGARLLAENCLTSEVFEFSDIYRYSRTFIDET